MAGYSPHRENSCCSDDDRPWSSRALFENNADSFVMNERGRSQKPSMHSGTMDKALHDSPHIMGSMDGK